MLGDLLHRRTELLHQCLVFHHRLVIVEFRCIEKFVYTIPGSISFTRTPISRSSNRSASEIPSTANFVPLYVVPSGYVTFPAMDPTSTSTPDRICRIPGTTARVVASNPTTFVSNCLRILSTEVASNNPYTPKPALFTSTSIAPNRSSACFTAATMELSSVTSSAVTSTFSFSANSPADSGDRIVATTFHPRKHLCCGPPNPRRTTRNQNCLRHGKASSSLS